MRPRRAADQRPRAPRARGLRAIKSVLVVAGSLLRAEDGQVEAQVLFRALRDFNVPKILAPVRRGWGAGRLQGGVLNAGG